MIQNQNYEVEHIVVRLNLFNPVDITNVYIRILIAYAMRTIYFIIHIFIIYNSPSLCWV